MIKNKFENCLFEIRKFIEEILLKYNLILMLFTYLCLQEIISSELLLLFGLVLQTYFEDEYFDLCLQLKLLFCKNIILITK